MQAFRIQGGKSLRGEVAIGGAKNAGLPAMAAALLTQDPVVLSNVPDLDDIRLMGKILQNLGCEFAFSGGTATIAAKYIDGNPEYEFVRQMRASICLLGPMLARMRRVTMPLPGGCVIGQRPIDLHLHGLRKLGCEIFLQNGLIHASAASLRGTSIFLGGRYGSTVTGTANILCAATLAKGTTIIQSASCEPEIVDLCRLLVAMGAKIDGIGGPTLTIDGVDGLRGASHRLIADRIEFGTFVIAALVTHGSLSLPDIPWFHQGAFEDILVRSGAIFERSEDRIIVRGDRSYLRPMELATLPFPGFPTDLQAPMCALLTQINGISVLTERVYPQRFMHVGELCRMGADIILENATSIVKGPSALSGAPVMASDLRSGACLCLAALAAKGESIVQRIYHIDRGYEHLDEKLHRVGAVIERESM
ncbi:MAG: UDP-N-acetylglucosamine 1-carboxyvinyltransferase [Puniceicoccales bacterium]|jgi:UDP-N-acetylglucosamine 1-carboxyvinyltransferase|nr:UDP-N-acetylglucosamine 1-carboxyvinyltransferase [Puniceicoccales bacterium]